MTPEEIRLSLFLQKAWGRTYDSDRRLLVTVSRADGGMPTAATIEVEGSPPKGFVVLKAVTGTLIDHPREDLHCWILNSTGELEKLSWNSRMKNDLCNFVCRVKASAPQAEAVALAPLPGGRGYAIPVGLDP